jgi:hypothetical protein
MIINDEETSEQEHFRIYFYHYIFFIFFLKDVDNKFLEIENKELIKTS